MIEACGLPLAWAGLPQWHVLESRFGDGRNFLNAWKAWRADPQRCRVLHFVAFADQQPALAGLIAHGVFAADVAPLADALRRQCWGLVSGMHRLVFEDGHVMLTLCIGDRARRLAQDDFGVHGVLVNDLDAAQAEAFVSTLARHCHWDARLVGTHDTPELRGALQQQGFALEPPDSKRPAKDASLRARFRPAWGTRQRSAPCQPTQAVVVGGGLAGAAAASSLARRGWHVNVLDAAPSPASGASALPAGLLAPHSSPDDNLLSRLTRSGIRITLTQAASLLTAGQDWAPTGVREQRLGDLRPLPDLGPGQEAWQQHLASDGGSVWHEAGAWIKPSALVRAWLRQPGIQWQGSTEVERLERAGGEWSARDAIGKELARAPLVVVAAATATAKLVGDRLALHPVRGQVTFGPLLPGLDVPETPVNGKGHFLPHIPGPGGATWLTGSTYGRGDTSLQTRPEEDAANLERLKTLLPGVARQLAPAFDSSAVHSWVGVRCASADRRPLLGPIEPGLWVTTAMGSRGLTFAALCGELLAARLHGEPLPLERRLAEALFVERQLR